MRTSIVLLALVLGLVAPSAAHAQAVLLYGDSLTSQTTRETVAG
jgi:hypothetical protein